MDSLHNKPKQEQIAAAKKDAVFSALIEFIGTLTGMNPPPIEVAPPEILKPFKDFTEKVCSIFAAPQPSQQEPVAWITKTGNVWKTKADETDTPLYTTPPQRKPLTNEEIEVLLSEYEQPYAWFQFARAIEAAHGITQEKYTYGTPLMDAIKGKP